MKEQSVLKISGSNFLSPQKSRARILKTQKARSRTLKIEKVSGSHKKMTVSLSRKVSHLPFTTPFILVFYVAMFSPIAYLHRST